jgi:hypothetical protein
VEGQTVLQTGQMTDGNMSRALVWNQHQSMYQELLPFSASHFTLCRRPSLALYLEVTCKLLLHMLVSAIEDNQGLILQWALMYCNMHRS